MSDNKIRFSLKNDYGFLSNFYFEPIIDGTGVEWKTNEHYYQAMKTVNMIERGEIWKAKTPKEARRLGRKCTMRTNWDDIKDYIMYDALMLKFSSKSNLAQELLKTGDTELIEWAPWDNYWGDGGDGNGKNRLGVLLMARRKELQTTVDIVPELIEDGC